MINLLDQVFGRLTVQKFAGVNRLRHAMWVCECRCGTVKTIAGYSLTAGHTTSCGCRQREIATNILSVRGEDSPSFKHGRSTSSVYRTWQSMKDRCLNPKNSDWKWYGGAGVMICRRWLDFQNFLADVGERPVGTTLGRFGDIGNYEPSNVTWQTWKEQRITQAIKLLEELVKP